MPSIWKWKVEARGPNLSISEFVWGMWPKVKFFCWLAWLGRIKTSMFLQRIGVLNANASILCLFCRDEPESINHVLLHCPKVWLIWSGVMKWWDLRWAMPLWWDGGRMKKKERKFWKVVSLILMWSLWKMRNGVLFKGSQLVIDEMLEVIKTRVAIWA